MNTISDLDSADLASAYAIEIQSHIFPWSKALFYSNQGHHYRNYKICRNNDMVGFCIIHTLLDEATIFNIAIHPNQRHLGLATNLLNHVLQRLHQEGVKTIWLEVRASNRPAIRLYENLGFHPISTRPNYYSAHHGRREDAIIMAKQLQTEL